MYARFRLRACGPKSQQQKIPANNREILPAQCVVKREKTKYTLFFIVRPIQTCERIIACLTHIQFNPV